MRLIRTGIFYLGLGVFCAGTMAGCSRQEISAKILMYKAEDRFYKADYLLKNKKVPYPERAKVYREACQYFMAAYRMDKRIFMLARIEQAGIACRAGEDVESVETLVAFEEEYARKHPKENEYGDVVMAGALEG